MQQKKASVLSVLVTDLVRTNAIFETDFGVHLNYVDNEDTIIFLNGNTDPFQSSAVGYLTGKWNTQSQTALDNYIGSSNYDVGHLLMGYATGGNAGCIGCVCNNSLKGSGATGFTTDLTTDPFIVDFWDHEIGHQFGANHTFDYSYEGHYCTNGAWQWFHYHGLCRYNRFNRYSAAQRSIFSCY